MEGCSIVYIGIDDTDSLRGMCTTYLATVLIEEAIRQGLDVIGYPRLVRLNPNIPWKTRGNGAISLKFGKGHGKKFPIGAIKGKEIFAYPRGENIEIPMERFLKRIEPYFFLQDPKTSPGVVITSKKLPEKMYWRAVRGVVSLETLEKELKILGVKYKKYKEGRGIIGASAAIAWRAKRYTYELLTYLPKEKWNWERFIDEKSVIAMDKKIKSTFDNYDYENSYVAIMPNSKTPVLYGIRGTVPEDLMRAKDMIVSDEYESWLIFLTNQGSDDHLIRKKISQVRDFENVILRGMVETKPKKIEGGHVIFRLKDDSGNIDCAAYEPTKDFRKVIEKLYPGDVVEVYGSVRKIPRSINIEKIRILKLTEVKVKVENPICPKCGRRMESIGMGKGYRCRKCGIKLGEDAAKYEILNRDIKEGWYEVPVIARRHIARPLKLMISFYS